MLVQPDGSGFADTLDVDLVSYEGSDVLDLVPICAEKERRTRTEGQLRSAKLVLPSSRSARVSQEEGKKGKIEDWDRVEW